MSAAERVDVPAAAEQIIRQTNAFRNEHRLGHVKAAPALQAAAQRFAEFMAANDRYGHEADGRKPADRALAHGYKFCAVAENIATQFSSSGFSTRELAGRIFDGWEQSPGHRANMLMAPMVDVGVGLAQSAVTRQWYAVQMFGRPQSLSGRFELLNQAGVVVEYELDGKRYSLPARVTRTHQGCFNGSVKLMGSDGGPGETFAPRDGARYTVQRDANGRLRVTLPDPAGGRAG